MKTRVIITFAFAICGILTLSSFLTVQDTNAHILYSSSYSPTTIPLYDVYSITTKQVKYNVPYSIANGTVDEMIPHCESNSLVIHITSNGSGKMAIDIPRNLLDMKYENEDMEFVVLVDGEEVDFGETSHVYSREYGILLPSGSKEIEIIGTFGLSDNITNVSCQIIHNPPYSHILPPLKQMQHNIHPEDVICEPNLVKIQKLSSEKIPACVKPSTATKLIERGWVIEDNKIHNLDRIIIDKLRAGEITLLTQEFVEDESRKDSIVNDLLKYVQYHVECCIFQIDRDSHPLYRYVGMTYEIPTKNTSITITYDLDQQKITHVSSAPYGSKYMPNEADTSDVPAGITVLEPDTMEFFYYPDPEDIKNRDVFGLFLLIRLPEWLGGDAEDSSAYRAYSAVSLSVDHCLVKYWGDTRQRIEQPCIGGIYRPVDGLLIQNSDPVMITTPRALPYLELNTDDEGNLYVETPTWSKDKNGVIAYGKEMTTNEIRQGSEFLISSFEEAYPEFPEIPLTFAGFTLAEIMPMGDSVDVTYLDFTSMRGYQFIYVTKSTVEEQNYFSSFAVSGSEAWQIGDTLITSKNSMTKFYKDGFLFEIKGENHNLIRQEIVSNFFPEYTHDDLFLVAKY